MLMSWNLLHFSANLNFRKRKKVTWCQIWQLEGTMLWCRNQSPVCQFPGHFHFTTSHRCHRMTVYKCCFTVCPLCVSILEGHPECSKFLTCYTLCVVLFIIIDSRTVHKYNHPSCRLLHFWTWQPITFFHSAHWFPTEWIFNASEVSTAILPNLKQKMMYTYSSWKSVNPQRSRNCRAQNTKSQCTVTHARTLKSTENDTTTLTPHSR